ncbi:hypothetical protein BKA56DRAFT_636004 [Ilyonectria sp. MPI-CAGE-AT-0026]|nr:hypothetical protein BKA56DRAFT_636004 [Ilyonectria sp. MPI-CAGE-AT-0026]
MESQKPLNVLVIGATGHGGSYLCVELVSRGHRVTGMARTPSRLGRHALYIPKEFDIEKEPFLHLIEGLKGYDVVVNMFSPHSSGQAALIYMPYIEMCRKIVRAAKIAKPAYFINVGGAGSLEIPSIEPYLCAADCGHFWRAFRQAFADSESQTQYMEERLGSLGENLRKLRSARIRVRSGVATSNDVDFIKESLEQSFHADPSQAFVKAARVTWMFFDGDTSWNWSYVSPPALYRPCRGGEKYQVVEDILPLRDSPDPQFYSGWYKDDPNDIEGRLRGISTVDFVRSIADDAESRFGLHKHWCPFTDLKDDTPLPSYVTFEKGFKTREEIRRDGIE